MQQALHFGIDAAAVILVPDSQFITLLAADEKTIFLFKVFSQESDPVFFGQRHSLFIDLRRYFGRTDRQRRSHNVKTMFPGIAKGFFQPESETDRTARPPFIFPFKTADGAKPVAQIIGRLHHGPGEFFGYLDQFQAAEFIFGERLDIGVVKKSVELKVRLQFLPHVKGTRSAADVQQQFFFHQPWILFTSCISMQALTATLSQLIFFNK